MCSVARLYQCCVEFELPHSSLLVLHAYACRPGDAFQVSQRFCFAEAHTGSSQGLPAGSSTSGRSPQSTDSVDGSSGHLPGQAGLFGDLQPALRVCGLAVSTTDEHLAVATAGKLMLLNITATLEAQEEAASNAVQAAGETDSDVDGSSVVPAPSLHVAGVLDTSATAGTAAVKHTQVALNVGQPPNRRGAVMQRHGRSVDLHWWNSAPPMCTSIIITLVLATTCKQHFACCVLCAGRKLGGGVLRFRDCASGGPGCCAAPAAASGCQRGWLGACVGLDEAHTVGRPPPAR